MEREIEICEEDESSPRSRWEAMVRGSGMDAKSQKTLMEIDDVLMTSVLECGGVMAFLSKLPADLKRLDVHNLPEPYNLIVELLTAEVTRTRGGIGRAFSVRSDISGGAID